MQDGSLNATVLICTRNPRADALPRVLAALERQSLSRDRWELLLVDNASTTPVAASLVGWHPNAHVERVERVGKIHAVLVGIARSRGDVLVIVDDDNVLADDYLDTALAFFADHPFAGVVNGVVRGDFASPPPPWMNPRALMSIGVRDLGPQKQFALMPGVSALTCFGAGMAARSVVARSYLSQVQRDPRRFLVNRSDDTDMALCAYDVGLAQAYYPALRVDHLIPSNRVTLEYVEHIVEQNHYGTRMIQLLRGLDDPAPQRPRWFRLLQEVSVLARAAGRIVAGAQSIAEHRLSRARQAGIDAAERDYRALAAGAEDGQRVMANLIS